MNQLLISIILGLVEGFTEFLPVSSSAHLIFIHYLLNINSDNIKSLAISIQIGPIIALYFIFNNILKNKIYLFISNCHKEKKNIYKLLICCFLGLFPVCTAGICFYNKIQTVYTPIQLVYNLILGSIFFIFAELFRSNNLKKINNICQLNYYRAFVIGLIQCLSLLPGISRLGITVATGLILGLTRKVAFEFSFLLFFFITFGTFSIEIYKNFSYFISNYNLIFLGILVSFFVSFFIGKFLMHIIYKTSLIFFSLYRLILACMIYVLINH
ncbi:MAG: undecaprenyl diphosphatase [Wigglesworthia glossinidia]|nr:undecaprenyl diphosphatase [Wigglesworthia glossinidia]